MWWGDQRALSQSRASLAIYHERHRTVTTHNGRPQDGFSQPSTVYLPAVGWIRRDKQERIAVGLQVCSHAVGSSATRVQPGTLQLGTARAAPKPSRERIPGTGCRLNQGTSGLLRIKLTEWGKVPPACVWCCETLVGRSWNRLCAVPRQSPLTHGNDGRYLQREAAIHPHSRRGTLSLPSLLPSWGRQLQRNIPVPMRKGRCGMVITHWMRVTQSSC